MRSKITIFSIILLLVAAAFAYNNYNALGTEKKERNKWTQTLAATNANIAEEEGKLAKAIADRDSLMEECSKLEAQHNELLASNEKVRTDVAAKQEEIKKIDEDLVAFEEKFKGMENVAALVAGIESMEQDNIKLADDLNVVTSKRDKLVERNNQITHNIDNLNTLEADQRARISPASLKTTIRNVYDDWNFVVLNGGIDQGVVLGSRLAVMRNGEKIAELLVNNVEGGKSSADVVPTDKASDKRVGVGDVVIAIRPNK